MDEIIKHDEGQVSVKVKLTSLPSVAQEQYAKICSKGGE